MRAALRSPTWWTGLGLIALAAYVVIEAAEWSLGGRVFPWVVGGMVLVCGIIHSAAGLTRGVAATIEPEGEGGTPGDPRRRLAVLVWIAGLLIALPLVGFDIALPLFIIAFMIAEGERWWLAVAVAAVFWAFLTYVLGEIVHVNLPPSWLERQFW